MGQMVSQPSPGWYPDPDDVGRQRYWDGSRWTDARRVGASRRPAWVVPVLSAAAALVVGGAVAFALGAFDGGDGNTDRRTSPSTTTTRALRSTSTSTPMSSTTTTVSTSTDARSADLGVPGHPIAAPPCDGSYIVFVVQATDPNLDIDRNQVTLELQQHPGTTYIRTSITCSSLAPTTAEGNPIYSVIRGPYPTRSEACAVSTAYPDAYVKILVDTGTPSGREAC
jgi:hypothetical protein